MNTEIKTFEFKHLIEMTAHGKLDLIASKAALKSLVAAPGFDAISEVLLDLRDVECDMPAADIHELVTHMAWHKGQRCQCRAGGLNLASLDSAGLVSQ